MSNDFHLVKANNLENSMLLASMHNLRRQVFQDELQWKTGLNIVRDMEFDQYDQPDTYYIIHTDVNGNADAACRLNPTSQPYMIADHYPEFIDKIPIPHSDDVWEISRFCASEDIRKASKGKITGQLIAAAIEFGLENNIKNYVALATDHVIPIIKRFGGWDPKPLGERKKTPEDFAFSVIYTVSPEMLETVKKKNNINGFLLFDIHSKKHFTHGETMEHNQNITSTPHEIKTHPNDPLQEMERTLSYLEAVAFARDYQPIQEGLRFTRLILQCDKNPSDKTMKFKKDALKALDDAYNILKKQLKEENDVSE